jgi:hypothetical protein
MQYEYYRQYLNLNLRCTLCNQRFLAIEIVIPATERPKTSVGTAKKRKKNMREDATIGSLSSK